MNQLDKDTQVSEAKAVHELSGEELATVSAGNCIPYWGQSVFTGPCAPGAELDQIAIRIRRGLRAAMDYLSKWEIGAKF
jgi:hypothetical protein